MSELPSNIRIYLESLLGRNEPITEKDFSDEQIRMLTMMAAKHGEGLIDEGDYPLHQFGEPEAGLVNEVLHRLSNRIGGGEYESYTGADPRNATRGTLGNFTFVEDPARNSYRAIDTYDFHGDWVDHDSSVWELIKDGIDMSDLETLAYRFGMNADEGKGIPVDIALPDNIKSNLPPEAQKVLADKAYQEYIVPWQLKQEYRTSPLSSYDEIAQQILDELGPNE